MFELYARVYACELAISSYFTGFKNKDVAFFHPASKSLIEADLLFNLPAREQVRPWRTRPRTARDASSHAS